MKTYKKIEAKEYGYKKLKSIGYLINETKEFITVAQTHEITEENTVSEFLIIPKENIITKREIK